jgi:hypothetical protein
MSRFTTSQNWGAMGIVSGSAGLGLNGSGTVYLFRNQDNADRFLFLLADLGIGGSLGIGLKKIREVVRLVLHNANLYDPRSYSDVSANKEFSAWDLHLASGAEASAGFAVVAGYSWTVISAWPFFQGEPTSAEVNNDYFTGVNVSGIQAGISAGGAYRFYGMWFKLWSFQ